MNRIRNALYRWAYDEEPTPEAANPTLHEIRELRSVVRQANRYRTDPRPIADIMREITPPRRNGDRA